MPDISAPTTDDGIHTQFVLDIAPDVNSEVSESVETDEQPENDTN
jgi:hypothetical protein